MICINEKKDCCGCSSCKNICPNDAINMVGDRNGFLFPIVDKEKCIKCGKCLKVCPILNNNNEFPQNIKEVYAMYNKDEVTRLQSSSGGIFSLLAEWILDKNGIVFGAKFNEKFDVIHDFVDKKENLKLLRGSKYVQSDIRDSFRVAKKFLEEDKYVLFSGTPCQIEGLKQYLEKEYDRLYTQDIICHGVPSPNVWREYLKYRKNKDLENPLYINFRNKDNGWNSFSMQFQYLNGEYKKKHTDDLFMRAFLRNASLRDSCYYCKFKKENKCADITLADFWRNKANYA